MREDYDFRGWATKNDLKCSDGRIIRRDAFIENNGQTVPLVWQHRHDDPINVLGHAVLENDPDGVICYGYFNDSELGQHCKMLIDHGDIRALSIYANNLKQRGHDVLHGLIKEVSLVLAGANPGASILAHSDYDWIGENDLVIQYVDPDEFIIAHTDSEVQPRAKETEEIKHEDGKPEEEEKEKVADTNEKKEEKSYQEIIDTMNPEQKEAMYFVLGAALQDAGVDVDDENEDSVK